MTLKSLVDAVMNSDITVVVKVLKLVFLTYVIGYALVFVVSLLCVGLVVYTAHKEGKV